MLSLPTNNLDRNILIFGLIGFWCVSCYFISTKYKFVKYKAVDCLVGKSSSSYYKQNRRSKLRVGEYLNLTNPKLLSPNGQYTLALDELGNLKLFRSLHNNFASDQTENLRKEIWWTNTGDTWPGSHQVLITSAGQLKVQVKGNWTNDWKDIWISTFIDACAVNRSDTSASAFLSLENSGALKIMKGITEICSLNEAVQFYGNSTRIAPKGKLAIVISGLFRTLPKTCKSHMQKVIDKWPGKSADVYVFTYMQDVQLMNNEVITEDTIKNAIRQCYGKYLKEMRVLNISDIEERFPIPPKAEIKGCGGKIHHLYSQLKTNYMAAQLMRQYMLREGITYQYVLRFRPDTWMWGNIPSLPIIDFEPSKIFLIHPGREHYYYCTHHDGIIRVGPSDQMAYGRLAAMNIYFDLYLAFPTLILATKGTTTRYIKTDSTGCEGKIEDKICYNPGCCPVECIVSYWLIFSGLEPEIWWEWQQNLLRHDGQVAKTCAKGYEC